VKNIANMTQQEKIDAINTLQIYIESAVESEQDEPAEFKLETQHRIDLILVNLKEIFGMQDNS
jgi:hypothetical protein